MRIRLLATIAIAVGALSSADAAETDIGGKWSTHPGLRREGGIAGQILKGLGGGQVTVGSANPGVPEQRGRGQRGNRIDDFGFPRSPRGFGDDTRTNPMRSRGFSRETALNANFKINRKNNSLGGSIEFRHPDSYTQMKTAIRPELCKDFAIEGGTITGSAFTFTTQITVRGVKVFTPWNGRLSDNGGIILEPLETLPCADGPNRGFGFGPGTNDMTFQRSNPAGQGLQGKWWTRDPGAIGVMELKIDAQSETVTGFFENICREERKLAGTFKGRTFNMSTPTTARDYGGTQWHGEMLSANVLRVTAEPPPQCMMERPAAFRLFPAG